MGGGVEVAGEADRDKRETWRRRMKLKLYVSKE